MTLASMIHIVGREGTHLAIWQLASSLTVAGLAFGLLLAQVALGARGHDQRAAGSGVRQLGLYALSGLRPP